MPTQNSPCTGYCEIQQTTPKLCIGCLRTLDEIATWGSLDPKRKQEVWQNIHERQKNPDIPRGLVDQMGLKGSIKGPIKRIISLVPSITQTLYDLGLENKVVGITAYCPKGDPSLPKISLGGTKKVSLERVKEAQPDIILGNKEENTKEDYLKLSKNWPVWMSDVDNCLDSLKMIEMLGELFSAEKEAFMFLEKITKGLSETQNTFNASLAYLIWKKPDMAAGSHTYIDSVLSHLGFRNVFEDRKRYPEISLSTLKEKKPDAILLPDEPYRFTEKEASFFQKELPKSKILLVKGEPFTWHGTSMSMAIDYFKGPFKALF